MIADRTAAPGRRTGTRTAGSTVPGTIGDRQRPDDE